MIVSFLPDARDAVLTTPFLIEDGGTGLFRRVVYDACCESLSKIQKPINLIVIPDKIDRSIVYSPKALIKHIRFATKPVVARAPILIVGSGALDELSSDDCRDLEAIGVGFYDFLPEDLSGIQIPKIDERRLTEFLEASGNRPERGLGRHSEANRWGAYALLRGLSYVEGVHAKIANDVGRELREDIYYKKKISALNSVPVSAFSIERLRTQRRKMLQLLSSLEEPLSVLVVEDQLERGWDVAYKAILPRTEIQFARTVEEANEKIQRSTQLIILDVRLQEDEAPARGEVSAPSAQDLSGVRFARRVRQRKIWAPIIVATASNKVWTLEAFLPYGINGYWVKLGAEDTHTLDAFVDNAYELIERLWHVLLWSLTARAWIDSVYEIADEVAKGSRESSAEEVRSKAKEFHALMHEPFNPFSNAIAEGMQLDLAYLIVFSMINELISWCCERNSETRQLLLRVGDSPPIEILSEKRNEKSRLCYQINEKFLTKDAKTREPSQTFPDVGVFRAVLLALGLDEAEVEFARLNALRNGLSLTHGKRDSTFQRSAERPKPGDISRLLGVYRSVVMRVSEVRLGPTG